MATEEANRSVGLCRRRAQSLAGRPIENHCGRWRTFGDGRAGPVRQWAPLWRTIQAVPERRYARWPAGRLRLSPDQLAHPGPLRSEPAAARYVARLGG